MYAAICGVLVIYVLFENFVLLRNLPLGVQLGARPAKIYFARVRGLVKSPPTEKPPC